MNHSKNLLFAIFCLVFVSYSICAVENLEGGDYCSKPCSVRRSNLPPGFEESVSFSGAAFYYFYQLGVAAYLQENYDLSKVCFLGASAGTFATTFLACDISIKEVMDQWMPDIYTFLKGKITGVYFNIFDSMRAVCLKRMPKDSFIKVKDSRRATFSLSRVTGCKTFNERKDIFNTNEELANTGFASGHIPYIVDGKPFAYCNGIKYIDAGFTDYQPIFDDDTIKVTTYMWSPTIFGVRIWGSNSLFYFLSRYGSTSKKRNLRLFNDGYQDAKNHPEHWVRLERFRKRTASCKALEL